MWHYLLSRLVTFVEEKNVTATPQIIIRLLKSSNKSSNKQIYDTKNRYRIFRK
jgi:hypothetical protein